jgi:hypothetical protein
MTHDARTLSQPDGYSRISPNVSCGLLRTTMAPLSALADMKLRCGATSARPSSCLTWRGSKPRCQMAGHLNRATAEASRRHLPLSMRAPLLLPTNSLRTGKSTGKALSRTAIRSERPVWFRLPTCRVRGHRRMAPLCADSGGIGLCAGPTGKPTAANSESSHLTRPSFAYYTIDK